MARTKVGRSRADIPNALKRRLRSADDSERAGYLESINKLLNTVSDLMKREPTIDREALEHLRRLRVRIRFAITARQPEIRGAKVPGKWLDRADKKESPVDFIKREYAALIGKISRPDIKRMDRSLYAALSNWISKNGDLPPDLNLPTKKQLNDRKLEGLGHIRSPARSLRVSEMAPSDAEQLRLYDVARQRKKRNIE
jgi:hypothetical protein